MKLWTMYDFITKKVAVRCNTTQEVKEFLRYCDEIGLRWRSGDKASNFIPGNEPVLITFNNGGEMRLTCTSFMNFDGEIIKWSDFMWRKHSDTTSKKYKVEIECDGTTTTAKLIVDGKEVKSTTAKKHPDDKFSLRMGMETAFGRLWEKTEKKEADPTSTDTETDTETEPTDLTRRFKVGDRVIYTDPESPRYKEIIGMHGRIVKVTHFIYDYAVEFDKPIECASFDDCAGLTKPGHGLWACDWSLTPET